MGGRVLPSEAAAEGTAKAVTFSERSVQVKTLDAAMLIAAHAPTADLPFWQTSPDALRKLRLNALWSFLADFNYAAPVSFRAHDEPA
jgi:hypothetical protein